MKTLERKDILKVLVEWGMHEARGRVQADEKISAQDRTALLANVNGRHGNYQALWFILNYRRFFCAPLLEAEPLEAWFVEVSPDEIGSLRVFGSPSTSLNEHIDHHPAQSSTWIDRLLQSDKQIEEPLLAVGRQPITELTFFDGVHRLVAWGNQARSGFRYPIRVNVITTRHPLLGLE